MSSPAEEILYKTYYFLAEQGAWDCWERDKNQPRTIYGLGTVEVVNVLEDSRGASPYGEYDQGSTALAGLVFKVTYPDGSVRHFEKAGTYDSYGSSNYAGSFFEVATVEKTIFTFERK